MNKISILRHQDAPLILTINGISSIIKLALNQMGKHSVMFVRIAEGFGNRIILHTDYESTCARLSGFGLKITSE